MEGSEKRFPGVFYATAATILLWGIHIYLREFLKLQPGDFMRLIVTSLLVVAFVWMILAQVRQSRKLDEFHRRVQCLALEIAFPVSLVALFAIGFFRGEGLFAGADSRDLFVVLLFSYAAGWMIAWKRFA
jgi:hypothetical protein